MTAYFRRPLRIFPQKVPPPRVRNGKNTVKTPAFAASLNVAVISVALPIVGMILFAAILLGLPRKSAEVAELTVIEGAANLPVSEEGKKEEYLAKAA